LANTLGNFLVKLSFEKDTFVILTRLRRHANYEYCTSVHIYKYGNIARKLLFILQDMLHIGNIFDISWSSIYFVRRVWRYHRGKQNP